MTITAEAMARVDGYVDTAGQSARINRLRNDMGTADWPAKYRHAAAAFDHLLETTHDVEELRVAFAAREAARIDMTAAEEVRTRLLSLQNTLTAASKSFAADQLAPALSFLHERLGELMAEVRLLDDTLGGVTSIEAAIRGTDEQIAAWRELENAATVYSEIRAAQNNITLTMWSEASPLTGRALRWTGRLRNAFDHESLWTLERSRPHRSTSRTRHNSQLLDWVSAPSRPRWVREEAAVWPVGDDHAGYLRWLATDASPWVPTIDELTQAHQALEALTRPLENVAQVRGALAAYNGYYTSRGVRPVTALDVESIRSDLPNARGLRDNRDGEGRTSPDPRVLALTGE